jgi:hypothetical protein
VFVVLPFGALFIWDECVVNVPAGKVGVVVEKGERGENGVQAELLPEGRHVVNPFLYEVHTFKVHLVPQHEPIRMPDWMPDEDKLNEEFREALGQKHKQDTDKGDHE